MTTQPMNHERLKALLEAQALMHECMMKLEALMEQESRKLPPGKLEDITSFEDGFEWFDFMNPQYLFKPKEDESKTT